jgi:hypothetical protein
MLLKRLSDVDLADVQGLVGNVAESLHIDFKQSPVGRSDPERKEFLADVTAFANASGGGILYGVAEGPDAVASHVVGISVTDIDLEERRLADIIRTGTEPRLTDFEFKWLDTGASGYVLILRVARSWRAPHRVTLAGHDRFYIRNTRGKHPMNTEELRKTFTLGQALEERIEQFRRSRIDLIIAGKGPIDMTRMPKLVLHSVPLISFADPPALQFEYGEVLQIPMRSSGYNQLYTLEGPISYFGPQGEAITSYTLHFRTGVLEDVADCTSDYAAQNKFIPLTALERLIAETFTSRLRYWSIKEVRPPYYLFVSVLFVQGYFGRGSGMWAEGGPPSKQEHLLLPAQVIPNVDNTSVATVITLLRPTSDLLWNGFGHRASINFDNQGQYQPQG